jgi:hypothetical protein
MKKESLEEQAKRLDKKRDSRIRKERASDKRKQKSLELITQRFYRWLKRRFTKAQVEMFAEYLERDAKFARKRLEAGQLLIMVFTIFPISAMGYADELRHKKWKQLKKHGLILASWDRFHLLLRRETIRNFLMVVPESELKKIKKASLAISVLYPHPRQNIKLFKALVKRLGNGDYESDKKIVINH